jgi:hypothetical protein
MPSAAFRCSRLVSTNPIVIKPYALAIVTLAGLLCVHRPLRAQSMGAAAPESSKSGGSNRARIFDEYGKLPLGFEAAGDGKSDEFIARTAGGSVRLNGKRMTLFVQQPVRRPLTAAPNALMPALVLQVSLQGSSSSAHGHAMEILPGTTNYFTGDDPAAWRSNIPNYRKVEYSNIYPGIDLVYYGNRSGRLEHDFAVKPGADPSNIQMRLNGADSVQLLQNGDLQISLKNNHAAETATLLRPVVYQQIDGRRTEIPSEYAISGNHEISFRLGDYDHSRELIIDPTLDYSTFLGGGILTGAHAVAVDSSGNAYVVGHSNGSFPLTKGAYDTGCPGCSAAFVSKLNPTGTALLYSTFLTGSNYTQANAVAVDNTGAAYVAGITEEGGYPVTKGAIQTTYGGAFSNGFVTKLNPSGSALDYSTYLGGNGPSTCYTASVGAQADQVTAIAVDSSGDAYVTGCTSSKDFPITKTTFENTCGGCEVGHASAFGAKLNPTGAALLYSTFLGGNGLDFGFGIAVDSTDHAYITGSTTSTNLKVTSGAYQKDLRANGGQNAFIVKLGTAGSSANYYTYLGGNTVDGAYAIAVNDVYEAYVAGYTSSDDFPTTTGAYQRTCHDCADFDTGFVTEINGSGSGLVFSTFLGGSGFDTLTGIALDSKMDVFVTGLTESTNFPVSSNAYKKTCTQCSTSSGKSSAVFTELNPTGTALTYSTYLGGSDSESGTAITVDRFGNAYVVGQATSTNFPISAEAVQPTCPDCGEGTAAFVTKFYLGSAAPSLSISPASLNFGDQALKQTSKALDLTFKNSGEGPLQISSFTIVGADPDDFGGAQNCGVVVPPGASCLAAVDFKPAALGARSATLDVTDNASGSPQAVKLSGTGVTPEPVAHFSETSVNFGSIEIDSEAETTITLTNTGTASLAVTAASLTGSGGANFGANTNCGQDITPGGSCTFTVAFEPTAAKTYTADLNVTTSASKTAVQIPLTGTGVTDK